MLRTALTTILLTLAATTLQAQKMWVNGHWVDTTAHPDSTAAALRVRNTAAVPPATVRRAAARITDEERRRVFDLEASHRDVSERMLNVYAYAPAIFDRYDIPLMCTRDSVALPARGIIRADSIARLTDIVSLDRFSAAADADRRGRRLRLQYMIDNPRSVRYNSSLFDTQSKIYATTFDPTTAQIPVNEVTDSLLSGSDAEIAMPVIARRNWLHSFTGLVQFTQAYNSPNWYQGGNSNLNMLVDAKYSINLNTKFHPDLLFENTLQYKLVLTSAPEDELRNYSINEDLLQFNSKFGIRAARRWFYSLSAQLKTQTLHNYISNTNDLKAAFMSPGEINVGLGMTYNYKNPKETFAFDLTVAPISYNLKTCLEERVDGTAFGIEPGHRTDHQFGSNMEAKVNWQLAYNINLSSRLYAFTDYDYVQGDLETTLSFSINKFLSTQIYAHLRYDSQTPRLEDSRWHKWQLKEIFSFGFSYKFANT